MKLFIILTLTLCLCLLVESNNPIYKNLNTGIEKIFRKQVIIGDPIGVMFDKVRDVTTNRKLSIEKENKKNIIYSYDTSSKNTLKDQKQSYLNSPSFEGLVIPLPDEYQREYIPPSYKNITHIPIGTISKTSCSGVGVEVGEVRNICERNDCHVTRLRCPPNLDTIIPSENYTLITNLSQCNVEQLACYDKSFYFPDWEQTFIYQLLCNGEVTSPDNGDLDHCSVLTILEKEILYNFTYSSYEDPKCWVDEVKCPNYCENISFECEDIPIICPDNTPIQCIDSYLHCNSSMIICNGNSITCNNPNVNCKDYFPNCSDFSVICNNENPCSTNINGTIYEYQPVCNNDGLVMCNGTLAMCDGHVIACADTKRTICNDPVKEMVSYLPNFICDDEMELCENIIVLCDDEIMQCEPGFTWVYNSTLSLQPICLDNNLLEDHQYDWYEYWIDNYSPLSSESEEGDEYIHPSFEIAKDMCRVGVISFYCAFDTCQNRTFACKDFELSCEFENTVVYGNFPDYTTTCNGTDMICTSDPECIVEQRPCEEDEPCVSLVYRCDMDKPTKCSYEYFNCTDGCWTKDGDWECLCPLDYWGETCQDKRPYACEFNLWDPLPDCKPFDDPNTNKLETDPICYLNSVHDDIKFKYTLNCFFTNTTDIEKSNDDRVSFDYFARRGNDFAMSSDEHITVLLKVVNFKKLSDTLGSTLLTLTPNQAANFEPFYLELNIAALFDSHSKRAKYFTSGRLYFEVDISNSKYGVKPDGVIYSIADRHFIDFYNFEEENDTVQSTDGFLYYLFTQFADPTLMIAIFAASVSVWYFVKKHQEYTISKELADIKQFKND